MPDALPATQTGNTSPGNSAAEFGHATKGANLATRSPSLPSKDHVLCRHAARES